MSLRKIEDGEADIYKSEEIAPDAEGKTFIKKLDFGEFSYTINLLENDLVEVITSFNDMRGTIVDKFIGETKSLGVIGAICYKLNKYSKTYGRNTAIRMIREGK